MQQGSALSEKVAKANFFDNGFFRVLAKVGEAISFQWLQAKIDKKIESSKMGSFWKSILHTVTSVGIGALSTAALAAGAALLGPAAGAIGGALKGAASFIGQGLATVGQALATGANYLYQGVKAVGSFIGRGISNAFDATKSFFSNIGQKIFGTRNAPVNATELTRYGSSGGFALGNEFAGRITVIPDAFRLEKIPTALAQGPNGLPSEILQGNSRFILNPVSGNIFRGNLDAGDLVFVKPAPATDGAFKVERIGNLIGEDLATTTKALDNVRNLGRKIVTSFPEGRILRITSEDSSKNLLDRLSAFFRGKAVIPVPVRVGISGVKVSFELGFQSPSSLIRSTIAGPFGSLPSLERVNYSVFGFRGKIPDQPRPQFDPVYFFTPGPLPQSRYERTTESTRWWELYEDN